MVLVFLLIITEFSVVFFFRRSCRRTFRAPARPVIVPPLFHHFFNEGERFCIDSSVEGAREAIPLQVDHHHTQPTT